MSVSTEGASSSSNRTDPVPSFEYPTEEREGKEICAATERETALFSFRGRGEAQAQDEKRVFEAH
jgi:hypothetical protein